MTPNGTATAVAPASALTRPIDFFPNPASKDPTYQWELAAEGDYNAIACHWGMARRYMKKYAGRVPLIFGRNMWQRPMEEALQMTERIKDLLSKYPS